MNVIIAANSLSKGNRFVPVVVSRQKKYSEEKRKATFGAFIIVYQRLTDNELDMFIRMRIKQLREEGAKEDINLVPALHDYYTRHMADGTFERKEKWIVKKYVLI